jgi:hypothetical protein
MTQPFGGGNRQTTDQSALGDIMGGRKTNYA